MKLEGGKVISARRQVVGMVAQIVTVGISFFKVKYLMTKTEVEIFASEWTQLYRVDSLEDLVLMFRMARQGDLGKIYNRVDYQVLVELWKEYLERKWQTKEAHHGKQHHVEQLLLEQSTVDKLKADKRATKYIKKILKTLGKIDKKKVKTRRPEDHFSSFSAYEKMIKKEAVNWSNEEITKTIQGLKNKSLSIDVEHLIEHLKNLLQQK